MNKNPPAFPLVTAHDTAAVDPGMTLRDWFAGQALAGLATSPMDVSAECCSFTAYAIADAMLAERSAS